MQPGNRIKSMPKPHSHFAGLVLLCGTIGVVLLALWKFQDIQDFIHLAGYKPSVQVEAIANQATMNDYARKLFYVNRPAILTSSAFGDQCPSGAEKTVVLGCYKGNDGGIYLYDVKDARLEGVVQVTAAHEMLHAAYARLSDNERKTLDSQLEDYYLHSLADQRIKNTIEEYKKSEPTEILNEMHSIFGTEVASLPTSLEKYYSRYFSDRAAVVGLMQKYQSEFTTRQNRLDAYDSQLKSMKKEIEANQAAIQSLSKALESKQIQMSEQKSSGNFGAYNALVGPYNSEVNRYNNLLVQTRQQIQNYNNLAEERNGVVLEQQQLVQAMSATSLPDAR